MSNSLASIGYNDAMKIAKSLINDFEHCTYIPNSTPSNSNPSSEHYPSVDYQSFLFSLKATIQGSDWTLDQERSSLCGPAAFFFILVKTRPDLFVKSAIELFMNGKSEIGNLSLESSRKARSYNVSSISGLDWVMFTSLKPKYDRPEEQLDGITMPGDIKKWFVASGYRSVEKRTSKFFNKKIEDLFSAQTARNLGNQVCLFVDAGLFYKTANKKRESILPNHWVVLNSDIQVHEYDSSASGNKPPIIINQDFVDRMNESDKDILEKTMISLDVFTWGRRHRKAYSKINSMNPPLIDYFLDGFHGYIAIKP